MLGGSLRYGMVHDLQKSFRQIQTLRVRRTGRLEMSLLIGNKISIEKFFVLIWLGRLLKNLSFYVERLTIRNSN